MVITDKDYVINIRGLDPNNLNDVQAVGNQLAILEAFREKLGGLIDDYEKRITRMTSVAGGAAKKPVKKIKVKQG